MIEKKSDKKNCKITFILDKGDFSEYDDIRVLGDFNGWHYEKGLIMDLKKNQFKASISLKSGQNYEFRYILNGRHWFNDPQADGLVNSPYYGISNTLLVLEGSDGGSDTEQKEVKKTIPAVAKSTTEVIAAGAKNADKTTEVKKAVSAKPAKVENKPENAVKSTSVKKEVAKKAEQVKEVKTATKKEVPVKKATTNK